MMFYFSFDKEMLFLYQNLIEIFAHPTSIFALLGVAILILAFLNINKIKLTTKLITHMGLMISLALILHQIRIYQMPQGGSNTLGSMLPLLFIAYRYGPGVGYLAGFI